MGANSTIDKTSIVNNNTYYTNPGLSMTHIINGMAGNVESHSVLEPGQAISNITAVLDQSHYGFSKFTVLNATALTWSFIRGDGADGDDLLLLKRANKTSTFSGPSKTIARRDIANSASSSVVASFVLVILASLAAFIL